MIYVYMKDGTSHSIWLMAGYKGLGPFSHNLVMIDWKEYSVTNYRWKYLYYFMKRYAVMP